MAVRSGNIDKWTEADDLENEVGKVSGISSATAFEPLVLVRKIKNATHVTKDMLEVRGSEVIASLPEEQDKADALRAELQVAGLLDEVTIVEPTRDQHIESTSMQTRRAVQKVLF